LTRRISPIALCVVVSLLISTAVALADPAGKDTRDETITFDGGSPFADLSTGAGEKTKVRKNLVKPVKGRAKRRETLAFFGQMTDPQIMDEMSPGHVELADPIASPFESAWRPQEAWALQNFDQLVRNMNDNRKSPFKQGNGKRAKAKFLLNTGDMADSAQLNEARWYIQVLNGGQVGIEPVRGVAALSRPDGPCAADVHGRGSRHAVVHDARKSRHDLAGDLLGPGRDQPPRHFVFQDLPERPVRSHSLPGASGATRAGPRGPRVPADPGRAGAVRATGSGPPLLAGQ
jgi:hypothetical protein